MSTSDDKPGEDETEEQNPDQPENPPANANANANTTETADLDYGAGVGIGGETTDEDEELSNANEDTEGEEPDADLGQGNGTTKNPDDENRPSLEDEAAEETEAEDTEAESTIPENSITAESMAALEPAGETGVPLLHVQPLHDHADGDDFGQAAMLAAKKAEEEARQNQANWGSEFDENDDEGDRERARGEEEGGKRKRRRRISSKTSRKKLTQQLIETPMWVEPKYNSDEFISGPIVTLDCKLNPNIVRFYQSYGYDCSRPYNLHVLDEETLVYITGNYLHFYKISEKAVTAVRRSASGYGLGHVAIHPNQRYYAVGEKGDWPYIVIYSWPEQTVYRVLRKGTTRGFSYINFSATGDLLCSQGMEPDYLLTIWNWEKERIVLHSKAFSQDIYKATFSSTHPGHVTTCGIGHIRFWKMAQTFTGLKLQGIIGRFGKTEISDVNGYAGLNDGKVVSSSEWGNLLVWDGGLIVVEILQKNGKNCHESEITDILLLETGELLTVGHDGYLKLWESEVVDIADTLVDDSGKFELEPIHELKLSSLAKPMSVVRRMGEDESAWFIQDSFGKVWSVSIGASMKDPEYQPTTIFLCPGGAITALSLATMHTMMAVGTSTGHLWVMEYTTKTLLAKLKYSIAITQMVWLPPKFDPRGISFLVAFADGNVRLFAVQRRLNEELTDDKKQDKVGENDEDDDSKLPYSLVLTQLLRFHKTRVNVLKLDEDSGVLYSCGEDKLIFASKLEVNKETRQPKLNPLSFVTAPFPVVALDFHPIKDYRLVIAGKTGRVAECRKPTWGDLESQTSYNQGKLHGRRWQYVSVKSARKREERREERRKELEEKLEKLRADIAERRAKGGFVEEEIEVNRLIDHYRRAQAADDEEELYMPEKPCPVYSIYYRINKRLADTSLSRNFFMHVGGFDSGYIYECKCSRPEAGGFHKIPPTPPFETDVAIRCFLVSPDDNHLIFGMEDGSIRVMGRYHRQSITPQEKAAAERREKDLKEATTEMTLDGENYDDDDPDTVAAEEALKKKRKKKVLPPFPVSVFPYDLQNFVCLPMHDPDRGPVTGLAWSFDGNFLFSVAEDGSIFSYLWDPHGHSKHAHVGTISQQILPEKVKDLDLVSTTDSQDANALTLEELKKKAEADRLWELAEGKKEVLRKKIRELKSKFRYLLQKNNEIQEEFRVPRSRFEIDPAIREPKKNRLLKGVEEVYRRFEWQSAKSIVAIEKIEKHFFSEIETFHMIVKDISHKTQTHTFRHRVLTNEFEELFERNKTLLQEEDIEKKAEAEMPVVQHGTKPMTVTRVQARELIGEYEGKRYDTKTLHQIKQLEDRLQRRYEREVRWAQLNAQKVPDEYEDPADVLAIVEAREHLGDYKLKTADEYMGERVTTVIRRQRVLDLKIRIYEHIKTFNLYVLELREEKYQILEECRNLEKEIKKVHRQLPPDLQKPIPQIFDMEPCEEPEKMFEITREFIEARVAKKIEELGLAARKQRQMEILKEQEEERLAIESGELDALKKKRLRAMTKKKQVKKGQGPIRPTYNARAYGAGEHQSTVKARKAFFKPKTALGNTRLELALQFRCFTQDNLLKKLNKLITYFHDRVEKIRDERVSLQVDILLMSIKMLNLIQELDIVKEFDSTERAIMERLHAQKVETEQAKDRLDRVRRRLNRAKMDHSKMEGAINDVQKEVAVIIGDKQKFSEYLWKVYKKKIRMDNADEEESDQNLSKIMTSSSSSSTGDSTDSTSQDSGSDLFKMPKQKLDPNVCPDQLDHALYEKVCEFRAKRTQLEIEAEAQKKVVSKVERDYQEVEKIYKKYTGRLEGIDQEVQIVQKKKQAKMNELPSLVILKADQIQCLDEDEFDEFSGNIVQRMKQQFPGIKDVVLFPKDGIGKLDIRIEELKEETSLERDKHKRARHMMTRLREELNKIEKEVSLTQDRCKREMLAKFGRIVDLDDVCAAIINLDILDELMRLENRRNWHYRERKKIADEIENARDRLTFLTKENSENNTLLAILIERQRDVEYFLYKQTKAEEQRAGPLSSDTMSVDNADFDDELELISNEDALEELFNLEDILIRQETRIMILREAIAACKFKSGLPPLIPLRTVKDDVASNFMTAKELFAIRERRNYEVETLYVGPDIDKIGDSTSKFPSFSSPMDSTTWVPSERASGAASTVAKTALHPKQEPRISVGVKDDDIIEEEEMEEAIEEELPEEEAEEEELFDIEYKPPKDEGDEEEEEGEEGEESYPLNIIPDDQMSPRLMGPDPGQQLQGQGQGQVPGQEEEEDEEGYKDDPIPVAKQEETEEEETG